MRATLTGGRQPAQSASDANRGLASASSCKVGGGGRGAAQAGRRRPSHAQATRFCGGCWEEWGKGSAGRGEAGGGGREGAGGWGADQVLRR